MQLYNSNNTMEYLLSCCDLNNNDRGYISSDDEAEDASAAKLSNIGKAAYEVLRKKHPKQHHQSWNVTTGKIIGKLQYTPYNAWQTLNDLPNGHDDWFPEKIADIISRTKYWCDIMSLGPPDGLFMNKFQQALSILAIRSKETNTTITVRMMFGNIVGMPVNCTVVIRTLTKYLPKDHNLLLWVGAWRKSTSWNHAKIIAVDGKYLHTGGHNLWDYHYLKHNPVHDLSLELEGRISNDGHLFANVQWAYIKRKQLTCIGGCVDRMPDAMPMILQSRVTVSEYPEGKADIFPPMYIKGKSVPTDLSNINDDDDDDDDDDDKSKNKNNTKGNVHDDTTTSITKPHAQNHERQKRRQFTATKKKGNKKIRADNDIIPIISIGRYGAVMRRHKPADDAIVAMLDAANHNIKLALQDLGPVCIPGTKITLPGCVWPDQYLSALGRVLWTKGVDIEILLSNPNSIPGGLTPTQANYGNGWSCVDVASEIIKTIIRQFPEAKEIELRKKVEENLRVCFIRVALGSAWEDGTNMGMHAKHFIIDDKTAYVGSQNLYICDLAEWGVVIDDREQVIKMMNDYWKPMWNISYRGIDVNVQEVLDGLDIDRSAPKPSSLSEEDRKKVKRQSLRQYSVNTPINSDFYVNTLDEKMNDA